MNKKKIENSMIFYTFLTIILQVTFIYISFFIATYLRMLERTSSILPLLIYIISPSISSLIAIKLVTRKKVYEEDKKTKRYIWISIIVSYLAILIAMGLYKTIYLAILLFIANIVTYDIVKKSIYKKMGDYEPKIKKNNAFEFKEKGNLNCELDSLNDYNISKFLKNRKVNTSNYFYALKTATMSHLFVFGAFRRFRPKSYIIAFDDENLYMYDIQTKTIKNEEILKFKDIEKIKIKNILFNKAYEIKIKPKITEKLFLQANRTMNIIQNQEKSIENFKKIIKK